MARQPHEGPASNTETVRNPLRGSLENLPTLIFAALFALCAAYILSSSPWNQPSSSLVPGQDPDLASSPASPITPAFTASPPNLTMSNSERTFIAVKPDGVQRGLVGNIISRFENRGFKLVAMKLVQPSQEHLETHYEDLKGLKFFPGLIEFMKSGPICAMVWEGLDAVKTGRTMLGATKPLESAPGTIRGDFAIDVGRNVCHGSDSVESANKEIAHWFQKSELTEYTAAQKAWVYEK
ncbi:Nucleoside diphosphate kinase [Tolypocladium ophioglossoides CBS 100239]|uniref:Nucleoside diphosphate kinase n=1 Tax=Tolypocladium ophioglossoides (strain CBS 100239) TaxID=1163406 RepID=A0A0L0NHS6_TOLOC|nr:Nucleoside diphosphate kinase [Tolypocladium ophioglossoides CBS 100239]